jgi:hypothetical protein
MVHRDVIRNSVIKYIVPDKLVKLIRLTMQQTKMKLKINNYTEWFEMKTGVRQGDPLSALLFSLVLDIIITDLDVRGNITSRLKQICAYAYDIVIIWRTEQVFTDTFFKLKQEALKTSLIINTNKTKYLYCTIKIKPT